MSSNPLKALNALGQSVWLDNIHRDMLASGELARLVADDGLAGVTSNPTIFEKAIASGHAYDSAIHDILSAHDNLDMPTLFHHLAIQDIQAAADVLRPVFDATRAHDGFVSLEVAPTLANDTSGTVEEARSLHAWVDRPNLMIKVPATREGLPALETLIADGINVNVTLLFSVERYQAVAESFMRGLERRLKNGQSVDGIASVASFFVSRVDTAVDAALDKLGAEKTLRGRTAVANAKRAYRHFLDVFDGDRFKALRAAGAQVQRLLWASTGTKNPEYSDVIYVDELVGERTVTTLPPATYNAFRDHGSPVLTLERNMEGAEAFLQELTTKGVDIHAITDELERQGVASFATSYANLLEALQEKVSRLQGKGQATG